MNTTGNATCVCVLWLSPPEQKLREKLGSLGILLCARLGGPLILWGRRACWAKWGCKKGNGGLRHLAGLVTITATCRAARVVKTGCIAMLGGTACSWTPPGPAVEADRLLILRSLD